MPLPFHLRIVRTLLQKLNYHLSGDPLAPGEPFSPARLSEVTRVLRSLPAADEGARRYLEKHIPRLARTLALAPPPGPAGHALELGCYMQITPFLQRLCGYREVRGAYHGAAGQTEHQRIEFPDGVFECAADLFDAERDPFPYPDEHFDLVIAGEIIEHVIYDPMHLLIESRRVLRDGGHLLLTTPNAGSLASAAKALSGHANPQVYSLYRRPRAGEALEIGHVREYTVQDLRESLTAAGFEITALFTTFMAEFAVYLPLLGFLRDNGYPTEHRGEQIYCLAIKRAALPVDRYPSVLYTE